jgi:hypothetical protein
MDDNIINGHVPHVDNVDKNRQSNSISSKEKQQLIRTEIEISDNEEESDDAAAAADDDDDDADDDDDNQKATRASANAMRNSQMRSSINVMRSSINNAGSMSLSPSQTAVVGSPKSTDGRTSSSNIMLLKSLSVVQAQMGAASKS